jgi:hypothetical protein
VFVGFLCKYCPAIDQPSVVEPEGT